MKYFTFKQKIKHLPVFSTSMLSSLTKNTKTLKVQISHWNKKGLIVPIRRGLYLLNKDDRVFEPSCFYLANQIFIPSYISLESALSYYGLIPEFVGYTTSITTRKTSKFKNQFGVFTYQHISPKNFNGFQTITELNDLKVFIAVPEKALVDFVYLNMHKFSDKDSLVFVASYRLQNYEKLSKRKLKYFASIFKSKKLNLIIKLFIRELLK